VRFCESVCASGSQKEKGFGPRRKRRASEERGKEQRRSEERERERESENAEKDGLGGYERGKKEARGREFGAHWSAAFQPITRST
jgi:hypothetical protein